MKAVAYLRVSTEGQAERGVSLDAQRERVRAMATVQGADLIDIIVEAEARTGSAAQHPRHCRSVARGERGRQRH